MKLMKKLATLMLCICLAVPCFSMISHAAVDGSIRFNDPTANAGETVDVRVRVTVPASVDNINVTLSYDTSMLDFVSGDNVTESSDGTLVYDYAINSDNLTNGFDFYLKFTALKAGETEIQIAARNIASDDEITWKEGFSKVTIGEGTGTVTDTPDEPTTDEPTTDEPTTDDPTTNVEVNVYNITISSTTTINLIEDVSGVTLPERFVPTNVTMEGQEFPAWQDSENPDMYILYAENSYGGKSLYQYDTLENTYQRFYATETVAEEEPSVMGIVQGILGENTDFVLISAGAVLLIFVIVIIVLSVKLYNRNAELDELYDEYGIDLDDEEEKKPVVETEDDVVLVTDEEEVGEEAEAEDEEDDSEVEVEFYVQESLKEFFDEEVKEEAPAKAVAEAEVPVVEAVAEAKVPAQEEVPAQAEETEEEFYDDDDEFYDDLDGNFMVDFIDLDD